MRAKGSNTVSQLTNWSRVALAVVSVGLLVAACGGDDGGGTASLPRDPVALADLDAANAAFHRASDAFCGDTKTYIATIDRYGKVFNDDTATVGDVQTLGADLSAPRASVTSAGAAVSDAGAAVGTAEAQLA